MTNSTQPIEPNEYFFSHEDQVFVSDIINRSKLLITVDSDTGVITKGRLVFNDVTSRLTERPQAGDDASDFQRGDFWTNSTEYMYVRGTTRKIWVTPVNDTVRGGGGGGLTPQDRQTIYSRDIYAKNTVYHDSTSAARPTVSNVTALANRQATFNVDGGWTHTQTDTSTYKADIFILASGQGDSNASGFAGVPEAITQATEVKPYAAQGGRQIQDGDVEDGTLTEGKLVQALQDKINEEGAQVKPYAAQGGRQIQGGDVEDGTLGEAKLDTTTQTKINRQATAVKPYAAQGGRAIQNGDIEDETIEEDKFSSAVQTKLNATGGANDSVTSVGIRGDGAETFLTSRTRGGSDNAIGFRTVPAGGTPGQVPVKGQGSLYDWADLPSQEDNTAQWAKADDTTTLVPDNKISNTFARESVVEEQLSLIDLAIQANVLPTNLRRFEDDLEVELHPEGVWEQRDDSTVGMNIGGAFLFSNDRTTTKGIPQEVAAVRDYSVANLPPAPNPNFVREHADPNEDSNPFLGVTPFCNGPVIVTTPANQRRKVFTGIWGQSLGTRPTDTNLTAETTMFSVGTKGLIRWNRAGIEVRTGADSAINRQVTQYLRIGTQNLSNLGNAAYTPPALASSYTGASQTFRLVANEFDADESVARQSPSVDIEANASTKGFTIALANRAPLTGNITYNGSTRVATINITGGSQAPGSHIELDVRVRNTFTYTRPSRTVYEALVLEDDVVRAGVRDIFTQNHKNAFVFAFEKQFDEDDAGTNIMKLVFRINGITREINLHQTYDELGLGGTDFRIGSSLQYVSHIQASTSTEDLGTQDLLALNVEEIGWRQLIRNHRQDNIKISAQFAADGFGIRNSDGTVVPFSPPASWASLGNAQKIPTSKLNLGAQNPSGIINPVVLDIPHFDGTTDVDTGRPVDGSPTNSWRAQYNSIRLIASYGKGNSAGQASSVPVEYKAIEIYMDALPANNPAGWHRDLNFDDYEGTFEKVGIRMFQPASPNGDANLHFHLYYKNQFAGNVYRAVIPGSIGRFANLRIAQYHDSGGQAYIMPRSAKGEQGDDGPPGPAGKDGIAGSDAQVKPFAQLNSAVLVTNADIANGTIQASKLNLNVTRRLNPEPANSAGKIPVVNQAATGYELRDLPTAGLDQNAVDARVRAGVKDFAEADSSTKIASGDTDFATRLLPSNPGNNQIAQWNGTAWVAINTPSGGGGGATVSGTSGWGDNLITPTKRTSLNLLVPFDATNADSIMVVAGLTTGSGTAVTPIVFIDNKEIPITTTTPLLSTANSYRIGTFAGSQGSPSGNRFNFGFSFTGSGASTNLRWDTLDNVNPSGRDIVLLGIYKKTKITGSAPSSGGLNQQQVDARIANFARAGSGSSVKVPLSKIPDSISRVPVVNDNYLHLGNADLDTQGGVVSTGTGQQRGQRIEGRGLSTVGDRIGEAAVRFLGTATTNNVPTGATYNETNGTIVLPAGHWIVCAAVNLHNPTAAGNTDNHRQYCFLAIDYDNNERHSNSLYMRNRDADVANIAGKVSVTGAVITDGTKFTTIRVRVDGDGTVPGDIVVYSAHVHAYRQII